jgi:hypothetical protein
VGSEKNLEEKFLEYMGVDFNSGELVLNDIEAHEWKAFKFAYNLAKQEEKAEALLLAVEELNEAGFYGRACSRLINKNKALEQKIEKLKKALLHYSDYTNNQDSPYNYELARQILKEIE